MTLSSSFSTFLHLCILLVIILLPVRIFGDDEDSSNVTSSESPAFVSNCEPFPPQNETIANMILAEMGLNEKQLNSNDTSHVLISLLESAVTDLSMSTCEKVALPNPHARHKKFAILPLTREECETIAKNLTTPDGKLKLKPSAHFPRLFSYESRNRSTGTVVSHTSIKYDMYKVDLLSGKILNPRGQKFPCKFDDGYCKIGPVGYVWDTNVKSLLDAENDTGKCKLNEKGSLGCKWESFGNNLVCKGKTFTTLPPDLKRCQVCGSTVFRSRKGKYFTVENF